MPKQTIDNLQNRETFQLTVNDSSKFNKSFISLALDNMFLGWLTRLKWQGFPVLKSIKDSLSFTLQPQALQTLADTQVRVVDNYVLVKGSLCSYYQIILDCNFNQPQEILVSKLLKISDFVDFLRNTNQIDLFWYDRNETIGDYKSYIDQLDFSINEMKSKIILNENVDIVGQETSINLRNELENGMQEIITKYKTRIRECFLVISVPCTGKSIIQVENAKLNLISQENKIIKALVSSGIKYLSVEGDHLHWLLANFISCNVRF